MKLDRQREILRRLFALEARDSTELAAAPLVNPVGVYTSAQVFEAERVRLFRERPVVACLSADVRDPGDCYATESGGVPVLIVRQADRSLRAFANICRHRGSPLAPPGPTSVSRSLVCGFHGWTYGLDGTLKARPHSVGGFAELDDACSGLVPLPVAEAHGMVLVRAGGGRAIDTGEALGAMGDEIDEFDFASYHRFGDWQSEWSANWKLLVETFLETYHVPALHPTTVGRHFVSRPSVWEPFGPNLRFHSLMKSVFDQRDRDESEWNLLRHGTVEYFVSPNAVLNYSVDHVAVYWFEPLAPDRTRVLMTVYTPRPVELDEQRTHFEKTIALHRRVSGGEDFPKQQEVQRALASGLMREVVFGRNEPAAIHFHQTLRELLGKG